MPKAASLAETIQSRLGLESELIEDRGGVFDVRLDGELIYSKHANGDQFPEHDAILESINQKGAAN